MYVYLLKSLSNPSKHYVGITENVEKRLTAHNAGKSPFTADHKPWEMVVAIKFQDDKRARAFEKYLKGGSGRAFANRHFW